MRRIRNLYGDPHQRLSPSAHHPQPGNLLPYFLDRAVLQQFTDLPPAAFIVAAIGVMIARAIVYGELFLLTRSTWPAVLMHSVEDAFVNPLFTEGRIASTIRCEWNDTQTEAEECPCHTLSESCSR